MLVDVVEDQIERPVLRLQNLNRLADVIVDHAAESQRGEMRPGPSREFLIPDDMMHGTATVLRYRAREEGSRVAES